MGGWRPNSGMNSPAISVVMPCYNQSHLVGNAIMSLMNQTMQDWELIIVDDGSWDGAKLKAVVDKFNDTRIRLCQLPENKGIVYARNYGNSIARAELIAIQDADDLSLPDRFAKCLDIFAYAEEKGHRLDVLIHGAYRNWWDKDKQAIYREYIPAKTIDLIRLKKEQYLPGWPIFKKALWEQKPFRTETQYAYDWMMLLDFCFIGNARCLDIGLYEYVRQENSASARFEKDGRRAQSMEKIKEIVAHEYS